MEKGSAGIFRREAAPAPLAFREWTAISSPKHLKVSHSAKLPLEIQNALKDASLKLSDLRFLAVGSGPGRFTGVRTAISAIRALAFALDLPVYPVDSLQISAEPFLPLRPSVPVAWNGFKNTVYFGEFSERKGVMAKASVFPFPKWLSLMEGKTFCVGDVEDFYGLPLSLKRRCRFQKAFPCAKSLAQIVCRGFQRQNLIPWFRAEPLYLRGPV